MSKSITRFHFSLAWGTSVNLVFVSLICLAVSCPIINNSSTFLLKLSSQCSLCILNDDTSCSVILSISLTEIDAEMFYKSDLSALYNNAFVCTALLGRIACDCMLVFVKPAVCKARLHSCSSEVSTEICSSIFDVTSCLLASNFKASSSFPLIFCLISSMRRWITSYSLAVDKLDYISGFNIKY